MKRITNGWRVKRKAEDKEITFMKVYLPKVILFLSHKIIWCKICWNLSSAWRRAFLTFPDKSLTAYKVLLGVSFYQSESYVVKDAYWIEQVDLETEPNPRLSSTSDFLWALLSFHLFLGLFNNKLSHLKSKLKTFSLCDLQTCSDESCPLTLDILMFLSLKHKTWRKVSRIIYSDYNFAFSLTFN